MSTIEVLSFDEVLRSRYGNYTKYVMTERVLPDPRDGLKPVQRRSLFALDGLGLTNNKIAKSARGVGDTMGKYHPHGDSSIYDAIVRMSQWFKMRHALIYMMGNNGSIDDDPVAHMRYTECGLSSIGSLLVGNVNSKEGVVDFKPNFDEEELEPVVLGGVFPNALINGVEGIGVGDRSKVPTHNAIEVVDAIIKYIKNPSSEIILMPDFPTGGIIFGDVVEMSRKGKGTITIQAKMEIVGNLIRVHEIPYHTVKQVIVDEIDAICEKGKRERAKLNRELVESDDISCYFKSVTSMDGTVIEIECYSHPEKVLDFLKKSRRSNWTSIEVTYNYLYIHEGKPRVLNDKRLVEIYVDHQRDVLIRQLTYNKNKLEARNHIIDGLFVAKANLDTVIELIRNADDNDSARNELMSVYQISEIQADSILSMRLSELTKLSVTKLEKEYAENKNEIDRLLSILLSKDLQDEEIISNLKSLKKMLISEYEGVQKEIGRLESSLNPKAKDYEEKLALLAELKNIPSAERRTIVQL